MRKRLRYSELTAFAARVLPLPRRAPPVRIAVEGSRAMAEKKRKHRPSEAERRSRKARKARKA